MNILLTAIQHYTDRPSGSARIAWDQALYMAAAGHRVFSLAPALSKPYIEREDFKGVTLLRYEPRRFGTADPRRSSAHQVAIKDLLRRQLASSIDLVHGHAPLSCRAACEFFGKGTRTCYTVHSPVRMEMALSWAGSGIAKKLRRQLGLPLINRLERNCLSRSNVITVLSEFTRECLHALHGHRFDSKTYVIPGWVDLDRFRILSDRATTKAALGWPDDAPVLFTLRRLVPRMGLDRLIRAVRTVRSRGFQMYLVIGGAGPLEAELRQLVTSLDLHASIRFAGRVPDADLPAMYGACDAFVLPTAELECFGLIALEALACGRPVLATPVGAIPEVMANFEPEWLASSAREEAIADLICGFLSGKRPSHAPSELRAKANEFYSSERRLSELVSTLLLPKSADASADRLTVKTAYSGQSGE